MALNTVNIREATLKDISQLVTLNMQVHNLHVEIEPSIFCDLSVDSLASSIEQTLNDESSTILIAEINNRIVGYALLQKRIRPKFVMMHERKCVYIDQVCVSEQYRNQGIFKQLLNVSKQLAKQWGLNRLELDVWSNNLDAKQSFLQSGFEPYNEKMKIDLK